MIYRRIATLTAATTPPDRIEDAKFRYKNFLFGGAPEEYAFGDCNKQNTLDITDDATGEPHQNARNEIAMYGKFIILSVRSR